MKTEPITDLHRVASRLFWWKSPEDALSDRLRFLAQVMTYGTAEDVIIAKKYFSNKDFLEVLKQPPAGTFDARSWTYWNLILDKYPPAPLPKRRHVAA